MNRVAGTFPVTMDVTNLYGSIPHTDGVRSFKNAMETRLDKSVPTNFLISLLWLILTYNIFEFDGKLFKQMVGCAMGSSISVVYACLFMCDLEEKMLEKWRGTKPKRWMRFIDDIWFLWNGTEDELKQFQGFLDTFHPTIRFTMEYDAKERSCNFLDTKVWIDQGGLLRTDLYTKECARVQYLLPSSGHPKSIFSNIPYSLMYRLKRICWSPELFEKRVDEGAVGRGKSDELAAGRS